MSITGSEIVMGTVAVSALPAVAGTVVVSSVAGTVTTTGPLTDAQLRASGVPVTATALTDGSQRVGGTVTTTGPLTDTQLRASAVPVSGPLTDMQLRASVVPVSATALTDGSQRVGGTVTTAVASATIAALTDGTQRVGGTVTTTVAGTASVSLGAAVVSVESSGPPLTTAATYFSTADGRNGLMSTYTEQRASDSKTRTVTITRDTTTGSITAQSASAWA